MHLTSVPEVEQGLTHLVFDTEDGHRLVFSDIDDAGAVQSLAEGLRAAPEAVEQQVSLIAQWAEIGRQFG